MICFAQFFLECKIFQPRFRENRAVYEMWKNIVEPERDDDVMRRMRFACWMTETADLHSECVILIFHASGGYADAPQRYTIRTLPVLLLFRLVAMVNVLF
jgi:predicted glycosyltransferase